MAVYAIGDVQGCYDSLRALLNAIAFEPARDQVWFTGDLVNRGPRSADVIRHIMDIPDAVCVLGNHDLHLLAVAAGKAARKPSDTLDDILGAPDRERLLLWLRQRPLLHHDTALGYAMVHAGLLPQWDLALAMHLADAAQAAIRDSANNDLFDYMYGDQPDYWDEELAGNDRLRVIINAFTRLRYCDAHGRMLLKAKGAPGTQPPPYAPWFQAPARRTRTTRIIFGHWSTLGLWNADQVIGLDTGCLWGGKLTAVRLDGPKPVFTSVACRQTQSPSPSPTYT